MNSHSSAIIYAQCTSVFFNFVHRFHFYYDDSMGKSLWMLIAQAASAVYSDSGSLQDRAEFFFLA